MALGNLRSRNASTALGLMWWVINPLLMGLVYWLVFGVILDVSRDLSYLLSGIFVFYYTSTAITSGANSIIANTKMLVNLQFPRLIMPITAVMETAVGFLVSIPVLYLIIGPLFGYWPGWQFLVLFPIAFVIQSIFNLGLASLTARLAVPFRDILNLVPHLLRIWLYLSPILYSADLYDEKLPEGWAFIANLNPMVPILALYRSALLGYPFEPTDLVLSALWALVVAGLAISAFVRFEGKMARYL
ncbi:MAG: ABC transporter permease [Acidimicrobiia bacterium]|nr:ABC transporter permease [Acidimicrobiia bacterium]